MFAETVEASKSLSSGRYNAIIRKSMPRPFLSRLIALNDSLSFRMAYMVPGLGIPHECGGVAIPPFEILSAPGWNQMWEMQINLHWKIRPCRDAVRTTPQNSIQTTSSAPVFFQQRVSFSICESRPDTYTRIDAPLSSSHT